MTKISRPMLAIALVLGMLATFSASSHAALSSADRSAPAVTATPAPQQAALAATTATDAVPATTPVAATPVATPAPKVVEQPRATIAPKAKPRRLAGRGGHPCH